MTSELVDKVFSKLSKELVAELLEAHKVKHSKSAKKPQLAQVLADYCREAGVQHFLECLEANTDVLKEVLANCKVETKSNSKTTLRSELKKLIKEKEEDDKGKDPITAILKSQTKSVLKHICTAMEFESEEDDLVHDIQEEILIAGAKNVLNKLTADAVKEQVKVLKIEHVPHTKTEGVNRILALAFPALDVSEEDSKGSKKSKSAASEELKAKRKPIEECKTADELYQNYYPAELQEYCREKGMKVTGKKMELIKRILAYLAGDHTTTMKDYKLQLRKKKSEEKKRKREEKAEKDKEKKQKLDAEKAAKKTSKKEEGSKDEAKDEDNKDKMDESDDKRKKVTAKRGNKK